MKNHQFTYRDLVAFVAFVLVAFVWRFPHLGLRDLALDEPFTLYHSQGSISEIIRLTLNGEPNPPLFMILVHFWRELLGYDPESLRLLPLLFNAFTAGVLYLTGKRFFDFWSGVLAASLFLFSNYYFYFSMELRPYGLVSLGTTGALYFFLAAAQKKNTVAFGGLFICNALLIYTHYFGWFVIGVEGLCALLYVKNKALFKGYLGVIALTFLSFVPLLGPVIERFMHSSGGTWVETPPVNAFREQLHALLNSGMVYRLMEFFIPIGLVLALVMNRLKTTPKENWVCLMWWLMPFIVMYLVSFEIPMFVDRYVLYCSIGLFLFIASFLHRFSPFKALQILAVAVLIFHMAGSFTYGEDYYRRKIKSAAQYIKDQKEAETLILIHPEWSKLGLSFSYDLEIFKSHKAIDSLLHSKGFYPVWDVEQATRLLSQHTPKKVLIYTDMGSEYTGFLDIFKEVDKSYEFSSNTHFPDNLVVSVFEK